MCTRAFVQQGCGSSAAFSWGPDWRGSRRESWLFDPGKLIARVGLLAGTFKRLPLHSMGRGLLLCLRLRVEFLEYVHGSWLYAFVMREMYMIGAF